MPQGVATTGAETEAPIQIDPETVRQMIESAASVIGPLAVLAEDGALTEDDRVRLRQQVMIRNMGVAMETDQALGGSLLLDYQQPVALKLYRHLGAAPSSVLTRNAMELLATNWGKTPLAAKISKDAGIGQVPYPGASPLSVTVLTSRVPLVLQTAERFAGFLPDVPVGLFYSEEKDLSKPGKVITYKSAQELDDETVEQLRTDTDLFILDEADDALGRQRQRMVGRLIRDRMAVLLSATDDFPEAGEEEGFRRRVYGAWGVETLDRVSAREALDAGIINSAQIFLIATGKKANVSSKRGSYTDKDLESLRDDPERDQLILSYVQWMAEEGIPGWTKCIGGGDAEYSQSAQARRLAAMANQTPFIDPVTGKSRSLRTAAVGNFQSAGENQAVLDRFNAGELDTIFYTKLLSRGIDSKRVGYVFATDTTSSLTDRTQDFGRGARDKDRPTVYLELVDEFADNRGKPVTFLHVVGESEDEMIEPGKVYGRSHRPGVNPSGTRGRDLARRGRRSSRPHRQETTIDFIPEHLRGPIEALSGVILAEITLVERVPPPKGWLPSGPLLEEFGFVAVSSLANALKAYTGGEGEDRQPAYHISGSGKGCLYFFNPDAVKWAREGGIAEAATEQFVAYSDARRELKISWDLMGRLVGLLGLQPYWLRLGIDKMNSKGWCLTETDYAELRNYVENEYTVYDPGKDVSTVDMADALGHHRTRVRVFVQQHNRRADQAGLPPGTRINFVPRRQRIGRDAFCLESEQAHFVMDGVGRHMPAGAVLTSELAERLDHPPADINALLAISPYRWHVKTKQVFTITNDTAWLEADDAAEFTTWTNSGSRRQSTLGRLRELAELDAAEAAELDSLLFDFTNVRKLSVELRTKVAAAIEGSELLGGMDETQRAVLDDIFKRGTHPLEVIARRLIAQSKIRMPEKPLVTNMQRHLAAELDHFLAVALNES